MIFSALMEYVICLVHPCTQPSYNRTSSSQAEEKMRVSHDRKVDKLKHLVEKGAEPTKIDSTRSVVRSLSTKIRIAIQIVDKISAKINKLRDEELWPQLKELLLGYAISYQVL